MLLSNKRFRAGLIGCGNIGREHARALRRVRELGFDAYCSRTLRHAEAFRNEFGGRYATDCPDRLYDDPDLDIIYICSPTHLHADMCVAAANAGKHLFIEKPLALTVVECLRAAVAIEQAGVLAMMGFNWRHAPLVQRTLEVIKQPQMVLAQMMDNRWSDAFWKQQAEFGGGSIVDQGVHTVDLLCHVAGVRPLRVYAEGRRVTHPDHRHVDQMVATFAFENGIVGVMVQGDMVLPPRSSKFMLEVFGVNASAELCDRFKEGVFRVGDRVEHIQRQAEEGIYLENRVFLEHLKTSTTPNCGVWDGVRATALIEACYSSLACGQPVRLEWSADGKWRSAEVQS